MVFTLVRAAQGKGHRIRRKAVKFDVRYHTTILYNTIF